MNKEHGNIAFLKPFLRFPSMCLVEQYIENKGVARVVFRLFVFYIWSGLVMFYWLQDRPAGLGPSQ